jgi:hypothetical protein
MNYEKAIQERHSVRQYRDIPLNQDQIDLLKKGIQAANEKSGLHIQLVLNEPEAFEGFLPHYGKFRGVQNYIALVGKDDADLQEKCGYYGEQIVLLAQMLGLNTCWVALSYSKKKVKCEILPGEKLCIIISLGYGENAGAPHKSKKLSQVSSYQGEMPNWFKKGVESALLAPTAINQQKFEFIGKGQDVLAKAKKGPYANIDLGIVKFHFEIGAGKDNFRFVSSL